MEATAYVESLGCAFSSRSNAWGFNLQPNDRCESDGNGVKFTDVIIYFWLIVADQQIIDLTGSGLVCRMHYDTQHPNTRGYYDEIWITTLLSLLHDPNTGRQENLSVEPEISALCNKISKDYRKARYIKALTYSYLQSLSNYFKLQLQSNSLIKLVFICHYF